MSISIRYIITDGAGSFIDLADRIGQFSLQGKEAKLVGGSGPDMVYMQQGVSANLTDLGGGADEVYLSGNFADYDQVLEDGGVYRFTRKGQAAGHEEVIRVAYSGEADVIHFADGHVSLDPTVTQGLLDEVSGNPVLITSSMVVHSDGTPADGPAQVGTVTTHTSPIRAIIQDGGGVAVPQAAQTGQVLKVVGSSGDDQVYVRAGTTVNSGGLHVGPLDARFTRFADAYGNEYGDLWINSNANLSGTWIRYAIAHEIGHTLGLKHPGNYNAGGGGTDGPYLDNTTDNSRYSVMSYNDAVGLTQYPNDYMLYDIAALQYLYGARAYNTGDTAISINYPTSGAQWDVTDMIYDTGGTDTLSVGGTITGGVTLDLVQGEFCSIGATQNIGICFGTVIENAVGTPYADTFIGNNANNTLTGGGGADTFIFGPEWGQDTITDFTPAVDHISFARDATINRASLSIESFSASGANSAYTRITHGTDTLTLNGVTQLPDTAITYVI